MIGVLATCGILAFALLFLIALIAEPYLHNIEAAFRGPPVPHGPLPRGDPGMWFGMDSYPADAIRRGEQGRTVARLDVGADGHLRACHIAVSSGSASLDAATCRAAVRNATFRPARDASGRAVASTWALPVRWVLPR